MSAPAVRPLVRSKLALGGPDAAGRSDAELLASVAAGDLSALGVVYDRHARDVWRVVSRATGGPSDVEDVVHATFLKLPELAKGFDGRPSCRSWLCGIAVRLALRRGRSLRRFGRMLSRFAEVAMSRKVTDPESEAIDREDFAGFERALAALPEKKRAVLVLIELQGMSHDEVARALGIPPATVRTRLFGARNALREALGRERGAP